MLCWCSSSLIAMPARGEAVCLESLPGSRHVRALGATCTRALAGIAYDAQTKRLFVTGKKWPRIFEVTIEPQQTHTSYSLAEVRQHCHR